MHITIHHFQIENHMFTTAIKNRSENSTLLPLSFIHILPDKRVKEFRMQKVLDEINMKIDVSILAANCEVILIQRLGLV